MKISKRNPCSPFFGRPLGLGLCHRKSVRPSVCNVGVLWPNGLSDRDDFWPCPGQQWPCIRRRSESPHWGVFLQNVPRHNGGFTKRTTSRSGRPSSAVAELLSNSSGLLTISYSHKDFVMTSQTVQNLLCWQSVLVLLRLELERAYY